MAWHCVETGAGAIPAGSWDQVIQTGDGAWTRRQLLAHMAANDLRQLIRIRIGAGIAEPGDEAEHAAELETHQWNGARVAEREPRTVAELLAEMRSNRSGVIAPLEALTDDTTRAPDAIPRHASAAGGDDPAAARPPGWPRAGIGGGLTADHLYTALDIM